MIATLLHAYIVHETRIVRAVRRLVYTFAIATATVSTLLTCVGCVLYGVWGVAPSSPVPPPLLMLVGLVIMTVAWPLALLMYDEDDT